MTTTAGSGTPRPPVDATSGSARPAVVVPFAFTARCRRAVVEALRQVDFPSELTVLHAVAESASDRSLRDTRERLIDELHALGCPDARLELVRGSAGTAIAAWIRSAQPGLVVVPRTNKGRLARAVLGSVVEPIMRAGGTRVLVLPSDSERG